ncbi:MAG: mucoidy inhibitor MuiA family protein [Nitrospiraceae bacterium]|nr:mucoidy inhibitor MuiA family protein [Nitrospiraceae bacterium]
MKNKVLQIHALLILAFIFASSGFIHSANAETAPVFKIKGIIVYSDRAMIKKESVVPVNKGENIIVITGVTAGMVDQSLQVSTKSKSNIKITDVKVERTYLHKTQLEKTQKLRARLDNLNELIKKNADEILALNSSIDFVKKVIPFSQNQKPTLTDLSSYMKFMEKSISENLEKIARIEVKQKKLREESKSVENELKNINSEQENSKDIIIHLYAGDDAREANIAVSYIVTMAGWHPQYDVRADSNSSKIDISYFALISQSTGEDWKDANVEISTAKPFIFSTLPELTAWNVDVYQYKPLQYQKSLAPTKGKLAKEFDEMKLEGSEMPEEVQVKAETTSFSFIMPWKLNIPSDNNPHKFLISASNKESKFEYYAVPKLSKYAYLKSSAQNPFSFPMLIGEMNVFLDGRFVNTSSINRTIVPDEAINLSLGVDEGIKVEKKLQKKFTEASGVFSKNTRIKYEYSIDVINGKGKVIDITLNDNFPVSRNEQIKTELESPKKEEAKISNDGIISWDMKLNPGEKRNISVKFDVEYPQNLKIIGLE